MLHFNGAKQRNPKNAEFKNHLKHLGALLTSFDKGEKIKNKKMQQKWEGQIKRNSNRFQIGFR